MEKLNNYAEKIHIKIENDEILIHHEDISDDYITIDKLFINNILNLEEVKIIYNTVKEISLGELADTDIAKIFKI
jgi:uncharacterized FlgJ-related protein